jgi:hypothetical protein
VSTAPEVRAEADNLDKRIRGEGLAVAQQQASNLMDGLDWWLMHREVEGTRKREHAWSLFRVSYGETVVDFRILLYCTSSFVDRCDVM